jgi:hypothetical protein
LLVLDEDTDRRHRPQRRRSHAARRARDGVAAYGTPTRPPRRRNRLLAPRRAHRQRRAALELQLENDHWLQGTIDWSPNTGDAVVFTIKLGGPHERHDTAGTALHLRIDPTEAWFRFPASGAN